MPFSNGVRSKWSRSKSNNEEENQNDKVMRQIQNARTRLSDAGVNVDTDTDRRNWFEKAVNLPQGQNFLFDALELLSRPSQAILGSIDEWQKGGDDFGKAAWRGFSGQERTHGSDLLENVGVHNKFAKAILGTGLEIALDPTMYIPGAAFTKVGRGIGEAAKGLGKVSYGALEKLPAFGRFSENTLRPAAQRAKDGLGYAFNRDYRIDETLGGQRGNNFLRDLGEETEATRRYMTDESMRNVVDAAKLAGGLDAGTDVGRIMEAPLKQFEDVPGYELPSGEFTRNRSDVLNQLREQKGALRGAGENLAKQTKGFKQAELELSSGLSQTNQKIRSIYERVARKAGNEYERNHARNVISATKEIDRVEGKLADIDKAKDALLKRYQKEYRDNHKSTFDLFREVRMFAKNGIRLPDHEIEALPKQIRALVKPTGVNIDELANEMGRASGDELLQELEHIARQPRKLDDVAVRRMALQRADREGALADFAEQRAALEGTRDTLHQSLRELAAKDIATESGNSVVSAVARHPGYQELTEQRKALEDHLGSLRTDRDTTLAAGKKELEDLKDSIFHLRGAADNPVVRMQPIERPVRELSDDQNVREAARQLTRSNDDIRQYALDNGIQIAELEGYMKHVLSKAEREARAKRAPAGIDRGSAGTGNPNKKVVNPRELTGSAEDINENLGREFFNPNAFFSTAIGQKQLIDYIQAVQFRRKVLSNPDFATKYEKGMPIGPNQVVIDTNNYKFIKTGGEAPEGTALADEVGGEYLVTKAAKNALDRYQKLTSDEGTQSMLKAYDAVLNNWKKLALLSPAYHARNLAGAMFNNYVGGMSAPNLVKYTSSAMKDVTDALRGKGSELFEEYRKQGLGAEALSKVDFVRSVDPEKSIEKSVKRATATGPKLALSKLNLPETSREAGAVVDQVSRFAMYKWARDKGLTPQQAAAKVRETQFDYNKLSNFEREVVTRLIPFYRWMRNNIPFQLKQITSDPRKYAKVNTVRENAQDAVGLDEETMPGYMKEQFALPVYGNDKTGTGKVLGLNLPLGDLTRLDDPLKLLVGSVNPLMKLPAELSLNRNFFTNKEIEKYAGDRTNYNLPGKLLDFGIDPKLNYVLEQLGGQPTRMATTTFKDQGDVDQADRALRQTLGISSLLKDYDVNKYEYYKLLDELSKLQDYMKYIEQQRGQDVRTISEINRAAR